MRFLVDAQLPPALARFLAAQGHNADHVAELGLASAADRTIWDHAVMTGAALITKDEDFITVRALSSEPTPAVVWVRIGNATNRVLLDRFAVFLPAIVDALARKETVIEVSAR